MNIQKFALGLLMLAPTGYVFADNNAESSTKVVDGAGTAVTTGTSRSDTVLGSGVRKTSEEVKTTVDPRGMMNKTTAKTQVERTVEPDGDYSESKTIKHADGTEEKISEERSTAKHLLNSGKTTTTTQTRSTDPAGLGNKVTVEVEESIERNPDGTVKKTVSKNVNGETVAEEKVVNRK